MQNRRKGAVIFFTGLSGSGKSTIAEELALYLRRREIPITLLDGDVVRKNLSEGLGFSKEDRNTNIRRIGYVASEIARHGGIAICAAIAPYDFVRREVKCMVESANADFLLVYLSTSLEACEERDVKGLYAKARAGKIKNFTGIDDPYEVPENPDIQIDTSVKTINKVVNTILIPFLTKRAFRR